MASFVGWCEHDVFVSYAHVDDEIRPGEDRPWVRNFVDGLETSLAAKLGRRENLSIWADKSLGGDKKITPEIQNALRDTATLIVILSPGYIKSEWCQREKDTFLSLIKERYGSPSESRVFVVAIDEVGEGRPAEFGDLKPYVFWTQTKKGRSRRLHLARDDDRSLYGDLFWELVCDLSERLKSLQTQRAAGGAKTGANGGAASDKANTVYLAQAVGELQFIRDDVERRLKSDGLAVLPDRLYPADPERFKSMLDEDLEQSRFYVQLLDPTPGMKLEGLPHGYAGLQFSCALELLGSERILCWYDAIRCPMDDIKDPAQRQFVENAEAEVRLWTAGLEEFKGAIVAECQKPEKSAPSPHSAPLVFVNAHKDDNRVVSKLQAALKEEQLDYSRPRWDGKPGEIREELTRKIEECDAQIVVFGDITSAWVDQQLSLTRKVRGDKQLGRSLAVYVAPPPEPEDKPDRLSYRFADMRLFDGRTGKSANEIREFVRSLKA